MIDQPERQDEDGEVAIQSHTLARRYMGIVKAFELHTGECFPHNFDAAVSAECRSKYKLVWDGVSRRYTISDLAPPACETKYLFSRSRFKDQIP